jgi:alkanesulfonate monooxygenase
MDICVFTEPQEGAAYDDLLKVARCAEEAGYDGWFRSDHYLAIGAGDGLPGPTDAWITMAGLARETSHIRLGTLMTSATFRHPGSLAIKVAQVDRMSGGRVELGIGAGWYKAEHAACGLPFPPVGERFSRLEEQLEILTGLWGTRPGDRYSHHGRHYQLDESPALPKPVQTPRPPIIIGGRGSRRTPALAARFADEFNMPFASVTDTKQQFHRVREAFTAAGRSPESIRWSNMLVLCCGRGDAEVRARAEAIGLGLDERPENWASGTPAEVVDKLGRYRAIGTGRVYLQVLDLADLDHIELVASEVAPQLRSSIVA